MKPRTLVELARAEAAKPRVIAGLSVEETAKIEAEWNAKMGPVLVEAAREQRKIRVEDLKVLDAKADGKGVALDDVLDFLLSPAGAPLQQLLAQVSKPDHAIPLLPGLDDEPDPPPWDSPPEDTFEAHLREARLADPSGLKPHTLLRSAVKAFAEATGKDGRVDEALVKKQGPMASALYTLIAQKTGGKSLPNPMPGQKLVGLDDGVVARVGRGVDVGPIRSRMKAFDAVVDQLLQGQQPLKGMKVVAIQHLLPTLSGVLDALEQGGVDRKDMRLIGKSYSTVDEMYAYLNGQGYDVHRDSIGGNAGSVEARLVEAAKDTLTELFAGVPVPAKGAAVKPQFLLADDGGKLLYALHKYFPQYAPLCAGFEQTARGIQVLEKMEKEEGIPVQCPVVNMAKSALKNDSEIPLIGENIVFDSFRYLDELKLPKPKTATVLGYGPVGEQVAKALRARNIDVVVYDPDPTKQAAIVKAGCSVAASKDDALGKGDLVVGCTGRGALDVVDDHAKLKNGAVLVNGASGNHELGTQSFGQQGRWFMEMAFEPQKLVVRNGGVSCLFGGQRLDLGTGDLGSASMHRVMRAKDTGKEVLILRSGHVVNLGRDLPPEFIQVTRALVFASLLQSTKEQKPGVVDVDAQTQKLISTAVNADLQKHGLSFERPDFTRLASWDL